MDSSAAPAPERLQWPLVGRRAELDHVAGLVKRRQGSVVLAGAAGVGKTRLGFECLTLASAAGFHTVRIAGTSGSAGVPFGAFASLVPDELVSADRLSLLRRITRAIEARGGGKPVAVLVDDAHLLDPSSAALLPVLAAADETLLVATVRSREAAPDPVVALWKDGPAARLDLEDLTVNEVAELLEGALGGQVEAATVHLLQGRTGGNALFLRELVRGALHGGTLQQESGVWRLRGGLPASSRLVEIIEGRIGTLSEPVRRLLGILALGEPLEVELLRSVDAVVDLEALEGRGLLRILRDGNRLVARMPHPLYGDVLRAGLSPLVAQAAAADLAAALETTGARRRGDTLRLAVWSVEGGRHLDPATMLAAAMSARRLHDVPLAERLARAAIQRGAGVDAGVVLAQALWLQGRPREALAELEALWPRAESDQQRAQIAAVRMSVLDWSLKRTDEALAVAEEAEHAIGDPRYRDQVAADRARVAGRSGRYALAMSIATPLLDHASGAALISAYIAVGVAGSLTGEFALALTASERGLSEHLRYEGPPLSLSPYLHLMVRLKVLANAGRLPEALAVSREEYDRAVSSGSLEARSHFALGLATVLLLQGRVASAARYAAEAAGGFRELNIPVFTRNVLAYRAQALAHLGDPGAARARVTELDALGVPEEALLGPEVIVAKAWTHVAEGDLGRAHAVLAHAATMAREGGGFAMESAALHDLARLGKAGDVAARLRELTALVEGDFAEARARHAEALVQDDPNSLEAAATLFEACGASLHAAEAAKDAAVAWRRLGETRRAAAAETSSERLAARCEGAATPSLTVHARARAALTNRELEIATLAAGGLTDKEIAARLVLSHRTVENRLHAVYEKLGLQGRSQLRDALRNASPQD